MATWTPRVGRGTQEGRGCSSENFDPLRSSKRYQDPVFLALLEVFPVILFRLITLKATAKTSEADHPEGYLNLIRYGEHLRHFCLGICPPNTSLLRPVNQQRTNAVYKTPFLLDMATQRDPYRKSLVSISVCLVSVLVIHFDCVTN